MKQVLKFEVEPDGFTLIVSKKHKFVLFDEQKPGELTVWIEQEIECEEKVRVGLFAAATGYNKMGDEWTHVYSTLMRSNGTVWHLYVCEKEL